jgi:hypothetical protein
MTQETPLSLASAFEEDKTYNSMILGNELSNCLCAYVRTAQANNDVLEATMEAIYGTQELNEQQKEDMRRFILLSPNPTHTASTVLASCESLGKTYSALSRGFSFFRTNGRGLSMANGSASYTKYGSELSNPPTKGAKSHRQAEFPQRVGLRGNDRCELTGELPVSLSGPIANPTTRQKFFLTLMNSKANRLWGRDPPVYCNLLSSCDRTSEQKSRCRAVGFAIGPDRLTGSSPLAPIRKIVRA